MDAGRVSKKVRFGLEENRRIEWLKKKEDGNLDIIQLGTGSVLRLPC